MEKVNNIILNSVKASFLFLFFLVFTPTTHADTYEWEQTLYGSGVLSTLNITENGLTFSGGSYAHINKVNNPADVYNSLTFIQRVSGSLTLNTGDLLPNTTYFVTRGNITNLSITVAQSHLSQQADGNITQAYPFAGGSGQYGFVYFQTDADSKITCWDVTIGVSGIPAYSWSCINGFAYVPPTFHLISTTSSFLSEISPSMIAGVQETGASVWPLFALVGVVFAFAIAIQLVVFTKRSVGGSPVAKKTRKKDPYEDPSHPDNAAYKRGRKLIEAEHPDFYKD